MPRGGCCPPQFPPSHYCHPEGLPPRWRRGGRWWGLSLAWEEGEPTTSGKKPSRSWMRPFSHLDRGLWSSFNSSSLLLPFEPSLTDRAPNNTPIFCPNLLACFLSVCFFSQQPHVSRCRAQPERKRPSCGARHGGGFVSIKGDEQTAGGPQPGWGDPEEIPQSAPSGAGFLPAPRLRMQSSILLP